jgi:DNA transposition AAA+ family ATPase
MSTAAPTKPAGTADESQLDFAAITGAITITPAKLRENYSEHLLSGLVTEEQFATVEWLLTHGIDNKLSIAALGRAAGLGEGTMSKLVNGAYGSGSMEKRTFKLIPIAGLCVTIEGYRDLFEQQRAIHKADFVETSIFKSLKEVCETALAYQTIYPAYGPSQLGKSTALEKIRDQDKYRRTIYVEMPAMGYEGEFLVALNAALRESTKTSGTRLRNRPCEVIKPHNLLIIDEIHQTTVVPGRGSARVGTLEYIRLLWNKTKCGLVLCGTNVFRDEVETGTHHLLLEQLRRRGLPPMQLPDVLPREDMDAIARAYGLPPAPDAVHKGREDLVKTTGLRAYVTFLKMGAKKADKAARKITWADYSSASDVTKKHSLTSAQKEAAEKAAAGKEGAK